MKILAFAASSSTQSINKKLATHAAEVLQRELKPEPEIDVLDLNDFEMPIYSADREAEGGIPDLAKQFFAAIGNADALIVSFAEHNGSYTAAYKNLFDWMSRIDQKVFQNKPMLLLSTSPGKGGGKSVLSAAVESAPFFAADVKSSLSVPGFYDVFDQSQGTLTDRQLGDQLSAALAHLFG